MFDIYRLNSFYVRKLTKSDILTTLNDSSAEKSGL